MKRMFLLDMILSPRATSGATRIDTALAIISDVVVSKCVTAPGSEKTRMFGG